MPILKPEIAAALRQAGLGGKTETSEIGEALDTAGLTLESSLQTLKFLEENSGSENTKLRAVEMSVKLRGLLKDQVAPPPSITIQILDPNFESRRTSGVNPVLLPRELLATLN